MSRPMTCFAIPLACCLLASCQTLQPRVQVNCDPPPIPLALLEPCPPMEPLPDGKIASMYQAMLQDAQAYYECRGKHLQLVAVEKYRDDFCRRLSQGQQEAAARPWWKFWN